MVLAEDTMSLESKNKPLQQSSQEKPKGLQDLSREINDKEREINRLIMIAEKDRRDSMLYTENTKRLNDQLTSVLRDFYTDPAKAEEVLLRCAQICREENCNTENARRSFVNTKLSTPKKMSSSSEDIENKSPNTPGVDSCLEELRRKDDELERVRLRAVEESARAEALKNKEKGLRELLNSELTKIQDLIASLKTRIFEKEKEILRYTVLAERDKKTGMQMSGQITRLRKSLQGFISAHNTMEGPPQQIFDLLARCEVTTDVGGPRSPPSITASTKIPSMRPESKLGIEYYQLMWESAKKSDELSRVKNIADFEFKKKDILRSKVDELRTGLVQQLQEVDAKVGTQVRAIQGQHQAIEKVAHRAEREMARSQFLHGAIDELSQSIMEEKHRGTPVRSLPIKPEKIELYVSPEIKDLKPTAATSVPTKIVSSLQDPASRIQSSPTNKISIGQGSSEALYTQKIQELEWLKKEKVSGELHLIKLKNLADEERQRNQVLVDRFKELQDEMRYIQSSNARTY